MNENLKDKINNLDIDDIKNPFFDFIMCFSKINKKAYEQLLFHKLALSKYLRFTEIIIMNYLNEKEINYKKLKIIISKVNERNMFYIIKIFHKKIKNYNYKVFDDSKQQMISLAFTSFIFNIFKNAFMFKNSNKSNGKKIERSFLDNFLNKFLDIIGKLYIDKNISDEYFEMFLILLLIFSMTKNIEKQPNEKDEIINFIFLNCCINTIKKVFNNLIQKNQEYTEKQEDIINNIILFINNRMLDNNDIPSKISYMNKIYLSNNKYKTLSLIDLCNIISNIKSKDIINNYINLLCNIYSFSFKYDNMMKPIIRQIGALFINLNKKNISDINKELNTIDFSLSFLDSLIDKESQLLKNCSCFIKKGFYLGNEKGGLFCNINSLENEFIILFGFRIESNELDEITLFNIVNNKDQISIAKFFLIKTYHNDIYELLVEDKKEQHSFKINVHHGKNYVFAISFKIGGFMKSTEINVIYVKDDNRKKKLEFETDPKNGREIKIKNFKNENIDIYFGCDFDARTGTEIVNKFHGIIGDIFILNTKNIKNSGIENEFIKLLLSLERNYVNILPILGEINENNIFIDDKNNNNIKYFELKEKIKELVKNENKFFNTIIMSDFFKSIEYNDEIDIFNGTSKDKDLNDENSEMYIKKKYLDFKIKTDPLEAKGIIKIFPSTFNKKFHIFQNELTLDEFIKYDGINYLSLLMEYNYQILSSLSDRNDFKENDLKEICKNINQKMLKNLQFFYKNIIKSQINHDDINKYFYQMSNTILKFIEIYHLNKETIECLSNILNDLDLRGDNCEMIESIEINLFNFLLNPKIYPKEDVNQIDKLNYMIKTLLNIIKNNSNKQTELIEKIYNIDILKKLMSFLWLFNDGVKKNKLNDNIIIGEAKKDDALIESTKDYYSKLLSEFLKIYKDDNKELSNFRSSIQKIVYQTPNEKDNQFKKNITLIPGKEKENKINLTDYFFDKALEYNNNNHYYIFSSMIEILLKTNNIEKLDESRIDKIKIIIIKELNDKDEKNKENKNIIFKSCFKLLIAFYYAYDKSNKYQINKNEEQKFHLFLRNINISLECFYALISSLNQIKFLSRNSSKEENKEKNDESKNENNNKNKENKEKNDESKNENNNNNKENKEKNDESENESNNKENKLSNNLLLFSNMNLKDLSSFEIHIIKTILEDIVYILYKIELKKNEKDKEKDFFFSVQSFEPNLEKEIYSILIKIIEIIFKSDHSKIYQEIFSSDTAICPELFYLLWKFDINECGSVHCEKEIIRYHTTLLKTHFIPFVFKYYLYLGCSIFPLEKENQEREKKINKTKLNLLGKILDILFDFQKEVNIKEENYKYYINNLLNYLIILNEEIDNNPNIFKNNNFLEIFYKYVSLLDKSYLLYSNFCIESSDKCGKIVSEIIYDIFFIISEKYYNEKDFIKIFIKDNKKEQEVFTIFYLIDICKENILEKERKTMENLKKFLPDIDNLKYIHRNIFNRKITKMKLILNKKLHPIEGVNLSIYLLAKSFILLKKTEVNEKFSKSLLDKFLPLLSKNIVRLYTKHSNFYQNKMCQKFILYSKTKKFIETFIIPNPNNFKSYLDFFNTDIPLALKEENNISFCYSSRLIYDLKKKLHNENRSTIIDREIIHTNESLLNNSLNIDIESISESATRATTVKSIPFFINKNCENINNLKAMNLFEDNSSKSLDIGKGFKKEKESFNHFELIKSKNCIFEPKNYFFKKIFAEIFKDLLLNDETFKLIKNTYFSKFRQYDINYDTKQLNYPITQKNFSNGLEPKIFMRRDFNYYDEERILKISHSYLNIEVLKKNLDTFFFYRHKYNITEQNEEYNCLECELVTQQFVVFGKMYFFEDYIFFESEKADPRDINNNIDTFINYAISSRCKFNKSSKYKTVLIYNEDIKEIIQKRTILMNQSIEIFHKNGKSYFFNFFSTKNVKEAYNHFNIINQKLSIKNLPKFIFNTNNNEGDIKNIINNFRKGKNSNYEYLLYLNKYSTRTYNDLSQYPVFPWLIKEHGKIPEILTLLSNKEINQKDLDCLRDMDYPISVQTEEKRIECYNKYLEDKKLQNFPAHLGSHYSTSAYIYYYLMRIDPYGKSLIKLQNYKLEDANRMFYSYDEIENVLKFSNDNREMIPDFFCYMDFFCNLNCCFFGIKINKRYIDDFKILNSDTSYYYNYVSNYVNSLYNNKKLLNCHYISTTIYKWVDIIFGKKQLPEKEEEISKSYNIYNKLAYEQKINLEQKMNKYLEKYKKKEMTEKNFKDKIQQKIDYILNLGMNPRQIVDESIIYEGKLKSFEILHKECKSNDDKFIHFNRLRNDYFIILKKNKKKNKNRMAVIYDKTRKEEKNLYDCKSMYLFKINNKEKNKSNLLYNIDYAFSYLLLQINKSIIPAFISCRNLGNYFKIQIENNIYNVYCEDFVTCIKERSLTEKGDNVFYTGLLNGKLTEWTIIPYLFMDNIKDKKNKKPKYYNYNIKELKHIYAHISSITLIEIYNKQNIIITAGEDKYIYIRKIFDFELLTAINLTYSFGNPITSKRWNIFPSLIKISDLNLIYVLCYDYNTNKNFIRGYNLNGLFFAETDPIYFIDQRKSLLFNNITFTKNSNLIVGFCNSDKFYVLNASNLKPLWIKDIKNDIGKSQKKVMKLIEYNYKKDEFYILYENEFVIMTLKDKNEQKEFDSF